MKLPFINEGIFESHKSQFEIGESSYIYTSLITHVPHVG